MAEYVKFWLAEKLAAVLFPLVIVAGLVALIALVAVVGMVADWRDARRSNGGR